MGGNKVVFAGSPVALNTGDGTAAAAAPGAPFELNTVQTLLFDSDQLKNLPTRTTVRYRFLKSGALEPGFDDTVEMTVTGVEPDGRRDLSVRFLSPPRGIDVAPFRQFQGNPLMMLFLERDVREMKRLTGGSDLYFRNRIRDAFARPDVEATPTTVARQGGMVRPPTSSSAPMWPTPSPSASSGSSTRNTASRCPMRCRERSTRRGRSPSLPSPSWCGGGVIVIGRSDGAHASGLERRA